MQTFRFEMSRIIYQPEMVAAPSISLGIGFPRDMNPFSVIWLVAAIMVAKEEIESSRLSRFE